MLKKGDILEERYTVLSILAKGGMSTVYLVEDRRLENVWVLKEFAFPPSLNKKEKKTLKEHFISEAKLCARISHSGIPKVVDFFTHQNNHYIVEEFVEGKTLLEMLEKKELKEEEILPIILHVCEVLSYIHGLGIIYRDLKPDNIMVKPDRKVKLIDFGIARLYKKGKHKDTIIIGTPGFAAPEQYGTSQTDPRSDVYSLGAVLHHMITGIDPRANPFHFEPPSRLGISIPPPLEQILMKSLSLKPEDRPSSVEEMRQVLLSITPSPKAHAKQTKIINNSSSSHTTSSDGGGEGNLPGNGGTSVSGNSGVSDSGSSLINYALYLIWGIVLFMFFALLIEMKFRIWALIPHFIIATVIVLIIFKVWKK